MIKINTIAAISTPHGTGGIAVIRISGPKSIEIADSAWKGCNLQSVQSHSAHLGYYISTNGKILDQAVATIFRAPNSFTGEDVVEISVHGSRWIQREVLTDLIRRGADPAEPGEFTKRAFLNGKIDLTQAEAIADLISATSAAAHDMAIRQTKGSFSKELDKLRQKLTELASLLELELDFSEEDVSFADRKELLRIVDEILNKTEKLSKSYERGEALKEGIPTVITGIPNAGKSSLLNLLLDDEKAIVSEIPGTTRDIIEDTLEINGFPFRIYDTAGLRPTDNLIEAQGIKRTFDRINKSGILIWIFDPTQPIDIQIQRFNSINRHEKLKTVLLSGKSDISIPESLNFIEGEKPVIPFSSKTGEGLDTLKKVMTEYFAEDGSEESSTTVINSRHYAALLRIRGSLNRFRDGLGTGLPTDLLTQDIRESLHHLGEITGAVTTSDLLQTIFSRFCIGK